jgi:serine/threonine protein kinase
MTSDSVRQAYGSFARLGPGSRIAGYLIEGQIGAGGMAVVFRARDEALGRLAAVKVIAPSMSDDEEFRARFLRESRAAAAVRSLHIIPVFGAGQDEGLLYIATHFVAGGDLAGRRQAGQHPHRHRPRAPRARLPGGLRPQQDDRGSVCDQPDGHGAVRRHPRLLRP